ncbi:hypothetical protein N8978_00415 [Flavobacteriaceae bacterium]|nr:hypothetical protein [Flavobacteriaceae bacterium]
MQIDHLKKKRGLFVFSDPGGAKPLLAFIKNHKLKDYKVISDRKYNFFTDFRIKVNSFNNESIDKILKDFDPDYILTGTSYTSKIELKFISSAKKLNIDTYSYIDHYTNYEERFILDNQHIFPKNIILIDNIAKKIAIKTKLSDHTNLIVINNFYHDFLRNWVPKTKRENFLKNQQIKSDEKIIVFAPDPISNVNEKNLFDENDIWNDLADVLTKINSVKLIVIVKFHPNQNKDTLIKTINSSNYNNVVFFDQENSIDLLYHSDIIVGMFSSILVEANVFKKQIIRHFPPNPFKDPLLALDIGLISLNKKELQRNIFKLL